MTRLTNTTRYAICTAAIKDRYDPKDEVLKDQEDALFKEAHAHLFKPDELALVAAVPTRWISRDVKMRIIVECMGITISGKDALPFPRSFWSHDNRPVIKDDALAARIVQNAAAKEKLKAERREATRKLDAILAITPSMKALKKAWPEGAAYYAEFEDKPAPSVPAVRIEDINDLLGLPK